jgi:uncharacterized protein
MSEIPLRVKTIISTYLNALQNNHIPVNQIILFGSYAKGNRKEWSDIDIALVSDIFEGKRFEDRGKIRRINLSGSSDLEVLPYRPGDFTPDDPFVREIMETGVRIV